MKTEENNQSIDLKITNIHGNAVTLRPRLGLYSVTDFMGQEMPGLAVLLDEVGDSPDELEPYAVLTVSLGEHICVPNSAYIDTNNCYFADQLLALGIAEDTGLKKSSGFCTYPLWVFKEDFLQRIGGEVYQEYARAIEQYDPFGDPFDDEDPEMDEEEQSESSGPVMEGM